MFVRLNGSGRAMLAKSLINIITRKNIPESIKQKTSDYKALPERSLGNRR